MEVKVKELEDKVVVFYGEKDGERFKVFEINILPKKKVRKEKREVEFVLDLEEGRTKGDLQQIYNIKTNKLLKFIFKPNYPFIIEEVV